MSLGHGAGIIRNGLVLHLDAANLKSYPGTGTAWNDLSGQSNNGTMINGVGYNVADKGFMTFDGVDDTINCGPVSQIGSSLTGLTVSVWINTNSSTTRMILENGTNHTTNTFYLAQENNNYYTFEVYGAGGYDVVYANYIYQLNTWYNLVGVWSSGNNVDMYTNGTVSNGQRGGSIRTSVITGNTNMFVGSRAGTVIPFSGKIGDVKLFNRALSAQEIQKNFEALRGRYGI